MITVDELKQYVEYLKQFNLKRIEIGGVVVEFDPHLTFLQGQNPTTSLEKPSTDDLLNSAKVSLKEALQKEEDDLFWSVK